MNEDEKKRTPYLPWPDDVRQLSTDEAWDVVMEHKHDSPDSSMKIDSALIGLLEHGIAVVGLDPKGTLCIQVTVWGYENPPPKE